MIDFLAAHPLVTIMGVLALGALLGQIRFGPLRFGAAGALFVGLLVGMLDPRLGEGMTLVRQLGVVLFCYTVGLSAGSTFLSDLRRQWALMVASIGALVVMAATGLAAASVRCESARWAALAGIVALTLASERVSFSKVIEGNPVLARIDRLGRA